MTFPNLSFDFFHTFYPTKLYDHSIDGVSVGNIMIRNNKHPRPKSDSRLQVIVNYRNAVYQGQYDH